MNLADRYQVAVNETFRRRAVGPELLPAVLVQACVRVLPVAGAGLSLTKELRIPLAASDDMAARAEQIQTMLGEGPCLAAAAAGEPFVAGASTIAKRWPMFHRELSARTPFRSVAALPLHARDGSRFGALDLYSTSPVAQTFPQVDEISGTIAEQIAALLLDAPAAALAYGVSLPAWFTGDPVDSRMKVWVAVGILIARAALQNADALAAIRAYAFSHDLTIDAVAEQLTSKQLSAGSLLD